MLIPIIWNNSQNANVQKWGAYIAGSVNRQDYLRAALDWVSGGNIDVNMLNRIINRGLAKNGRLCQLELELLDKPGMLQGVLKIVADEGGNILSVNHERVSDSTDINACNLHLELETLNHEHIERIKDALTRAGYKIRG